MPVLVSDLTIVEMVRSNFPDTYDKITASDANPDVVEQMLSSIKAALWGTNPVPAEGVMHPAVKKYVANETTLALIPTAISYYANRKVVQEHLEKDQRTYYDWGKILDILQKSLIAQNLRLWPMVGPLIDSSDDSLVGEAKISTVDMQTALSRYVPLSERYHVTPDPQVEAWGFYHDGWR